MAQYLARWDVTQSGSAFSTPSSELVPGIKDAVPVMLKVALIDEEARGSTLLQWWQGRGSATVLERDQGHVPLSGVLSLHRAGQWF